MIHTPQPVVMAVPLISLVETPVVPGVMLTGLWSLPRVGITPPEGPEQSLIEVRPGLVGSGWEVILPLEEVGRTLGSGEAAVAVVAVSGQVEWIQPLLRVSHKIHVPVDATAAVAAAHISRARLHW